MSPSTFSVNSFPKRRTFTLRGVRMVSCLLTPLRTLSYCDVVTLCAPVRSPVSKTVIDTNDHARDLEAFTKLAPCYSSRSAVMGSTRVALLAGIQTAQRATALRSNGVTRNATGSHALTPKRKLARKRVSQ